MLHSGNARGTDELTPLSLIGTRRMEAVLVPGAGLETALRRGIIEEIAVFRGTTGELQATGYRRLSPRMPPVQEGT